MLKYKLSDKFITYLSTLKLDERRTVLHYVQGILAGVPGYKRQEVKKVNDETSIYRIKKNNTDFIYILFRENIYEKSIIIGFDDLSEYNEQMMDPSNYEYVISQDIITLVRSKTVKVDSNNPLTKLIPLDDDLFVNWFKALIFNTEYPDYYKELLCSENETLNEEPLISVAIENKVPSSVDQNEYDTSEEELIAAEKDVINQLRPKKTDKKVSQVKNVDKKKEVNKTYLNKHISISIKNLNSLEDTIDRKLSSYHIDHDLSSWHIVLDNSIPLKYSRSLSKIYPYKVHYVGDNQIPEKLDYIFEISYEEKVVNPYDELGIKKPVDKRARKKRKHIEVNFHGEEPENEPTNYSEFDGFVPMDSSNSKRHSVKKSHIKLPDDVNIVDDEAIFSDEDGYLLDSNDVYDDVNCEEIGFDDFFQSL